MKKIVRLFDLGNMDVEREMLQGYDVQCKACCDEDAIIEAAKDAINEGDAVVVCAGLDAALASVMGGLTSKPIFAVPTSVGYGIAEAGRTALSSCLASCAPGVGVMNIDNGYGAACAAARVLTLLESVRTAR